VCTLQHIVAVCTATHCNTLLQCTSTFGVHTATHCNALQRTATHCNALKHIATHCNALPIQTYVFSTDSTGWRRPIGFLIYLSHFLQKSPIISGSFAKRDLQRQASYAFWPPCNAHACPPAPNEALTHCNTPLHTATQAATVLSIRHSHTATHCNTPLHTATHRNTPQHPATHCNTPQQCSQRGTHRLQHTTTHYRVAKMHRWP